MKRRLVSLILMIALALGVLAFSIAASTAAAAKSAVTIPTVTKVVPTTLGTKVSWSAYPGAVKYRLFYRLSAKADWQRAGVSDTTSFYHIGLKSGTAYTYTVRAMDKTGKYISSYDKTGYTFRFLKKPTLSKVDNLYDGQQVSWKAVKGAGMYNVYVREKSTQAWKLIGKTNKTSMTYTKVKPGTSYFYTVRCSDPKTGAVLSAYHTEGISLKFVAAPKVVSYAPIESGSLITWSSYPGTYRYRLYLKTSAGWTRIGETSGLFYQHKKLKDNTDYVYTVRAVDKKGKFISDYNHTGWKYRYNEPLRVDASATAFSGYRLSWTERKTAASYGVYRRAYGADWKRIGTAKTASYTDRDVYEFGLYSYMICRLDSKDRPQGFFTQSGVYHSCGTAVVGPNVTYTPPVYNTPVSGKQLRKNVVTAAVRWLGAKQGDKKHRQIIEIYNAQDPLPVGYAMQDDDAWCAAFTSVVWITAKLDAYTGSECGCGRFIDLAKEKGIWTESDAYVPKPGDAIIYNWDDDGVGECKQGADHIGIVTEVYGKKFAVTEGNKGDESVVAHRMMEVDGRYIRGYITPNYDQIARTLTARAELTRRAG